MAKQATQVAEVEIESLSKRNQRAALRAEYSCDYKVAAAVKRLLKRKADYEDRAAVIKAVNELGMVSQTTEKPCKMSDLRDADFKINPDKSQNAILYTEFYARTRNADAPCGWSVEHFAMFVDFNAREFGIEPF